jgi:hypothetical protein
MAAVGLYFLISPWFAPDDNLPLRILGAGGGALLLVAGVWLAFSFWMKSRA